jgi:transglutaminase-like putative cysteine protease
VPRTAENVDRYVDLLIIASGSACRDFAVLFVEAARSLGFGARIVSGYLDNWTESLIR